MVFNSLIEANQIFNKKPGAVPGFLLYNRFAFLSISKICSLVIFSS